MFLKSTFVVYQRKVVLLLQSGLRTMNITWLSSRWYFLKCIASLEMDNILTSVPSKSKIRLCAKHLSDSNIYGVLTMCLFCILFNPQIIPSYYRHITSDQTKSKEYVSKQKYWGTSNQNLPVLSDHVLKCCDVRPGHNNQQATT